MTTDAVSAPDTQPKAKIFISYSRKDMAFADRLEAALKARGFEPLIDRTEIYAFEDWWQRIQALIGRADTIVFVLSPDAVTSDVALKEVSHGAALNKRFAPIVCRRVEDPAVPEPLRRLNFIFFDDPDRFEASTDQLSEALTTDIGWVRQHTDYGEAARHRVAAGRSGGLLLRSPALEEAERWIASRPHGAPEPTGDTQAFVAESRRGATRRRNILTGSAEMTSRPHPSPSRMSTTAYSGALSLICAKPSSTDSAVATLKPRASIARARHCVSCLSSSTISIDLDRLIGAKHF
jgi:TIR domain